MRLSLRRWLFPVPACVLQQFVFGSYYALGIFASRLDDPSLTIALGVGSWTLAIAIAGAGYALHRFTHTGPSGTHAGTSSSRAAVMLSFLGALLISFQAFFPLAMDKSPSSSSALLYLAALGHGTGYGILYVVSLCVLQAWVPESPGTATGGVIFFGGVGTLCFVLLDSFLVKTLGSLDRAIMYGGLVQSALAIFAAACTSMPPSAKWHPMMEDVLRAEETEPLMALDLQKSAAHGHVHGIEPGQQEESGGDKRMTPMQILLDPAFFVLLVVSTAGYGPGFGVVLHGSRMQTVLMGVSHEVAEYRFFVMTLVGVVARLVSGVAVDALSAAKLRRRGSLSGQGPEEAAHDAAFESARDLTAFFTMLQVVVLVIVFPVIRRGLSMTFAVILGIVYLSFSGVSVVSVCLCRFVFGAENSTLAFSLLCLAYGVGDFTFSALVGYASVVGQRVDAAHAVSGAGLTVGMHMHDYDLFFVVSLVVSIVGLPLVYALKARTSRRPTSVVCRV